MRPVDDQGYDYCPECNGRSRVYYLAVYFKCQECRHKTRNIITDLSEDHKKAVLREHASWMKKHPTAWERATVGLRMFVPASDDNSYWP